MCNPLGLAADRCNHNHRSSLSPRVLQTTFSQNDLLTFFHFVKERFSRDQVVRTKHCTQRFLLLPDNYRLWWRMTGSNRRPPACKAGALPAELIPRLILTIIKPLQLDLVGLVGIEPTTPALSRRCSNQLSYRPSVCAYFDNR